jgi:Subtilase family
MRIGLLRTLLASTGALLVLFALPYASAGAALSPSAYGVSALCSAPAPGHAGCLGLRLVAKQPLSLSGSQESTRAAHTAGPAVKQIEFGQPWKGSLSPQNVLTAYGLSATPAPAAQQTLALVDAFVDPTAEGDLRVFDEQYGLPSCTTANGCFTKVELGSPATEAGWAQETATDIEVAHGLCPSCKILLVEANSNDNTDLEAAEGKAEQLGATEISNSWGGPDEGVTAEEDRHSPFDHPGTVITAAAGDDGYLNWDAEESSERNFADYPASSPHVIAVGGTRLGLNAGAWQEETVWNGAGAGGGGCATELTAPAWQQSLADWSSVGCNSRRAVADVAADADPYTGVSVYDSTPIREVIGKEEVEYRGWVTIGGTSVASPIIAATFALAGGPAKNTKSETVKYPAQTLYENLAADPGALHDVVSGSNGACANGFNEHTGLSECSLAEEDASCLAEAKCLAGPGYDGPSGVGTPDGIAAFQAPVSGAGTGSGEGQPGKEGESGAGSSKGGEEASQEGEEGSQEGEEGSLSAGEGSEGAGAPGGDAGSGGEAREAFTGLLLPPGAQPAGPALSIPGSSAILPVLSAAALTHKASTALRHGPAKVATIAFVFTLNTPARVQVTLAEQVLAHGHRRWRSLPDSLAITAAKGRDSAHLRARGTLSPGRYRLTLTPLHGRARTLTFQIG